MDARQESATCGHHACLCCGSTALHLPSLPTRFIIVSLPQTSRARRGGSESPSYEPLGFHPRVTPSVAAALVADIPADQAIVGARPPRPGSSHRWGVAVSGAEGCWCQDGR